MKVCLNTIWACAPAKGQKNGTAFRPGDIADVTDRQGAELIEGGFATEVPVKVTAQDVDPETETQADPESATAAEPAAEQPRKRTKHGRSRGRDAAGE